MELSQKVSSSADANCFKLFPLQVLVTIVLSYQVLFSREAGLTPEVKAVTVLGLFLTVAVLMMMPRRFWRNGWFLGLLVLWDTALTSAVIYLSGNASTDLYLTYFMIILLAAYAPTLKQCLGLSLVLCAGYAALLYLGVGHAAALVEEHLLRVPVLLIMAAFYGNAMETVRRERREKAGLVEEVTALQKAEQEIRRLNERLEVRVVERTRDLEAANKALELDIAARVKAEAEIRRLNEELEGRVLERTQEVSAAMTALEWDIAKRKRVEEALTQQAQELARSNAELERFAHAASHDMKEPLRTVVSYLRLLSERYRGRLDADADEFIGYAVDAVHRMERLLTGILTYAKAGAFHGADRPVECSAVLEAVLWNLRTAIEESDAVVTYENLPVLNVNDVELTQLFQNLIDNALKFRGTEPPQVQVSAKLETLSDAGVPGGAKETREQWHFSIRDNGVGIEPAYTERIFLLFQRLHPMSEYPGSGIGLAICKKIVESYGGHIWAESQPGIGTTFHFTLPHSCSDNHVG